MHLTKHDSLATPKYVSVSPMMMRMAMTMTNRPCEAAVGREAIRVYWLQESHRAGGGLRRSDGYICGRQWLRQSVVCTYICTYVCLLLTIRQRHSPKWKYMTDRRELFTSIVCLYMCLYVCTLAIWWSHFDNNVNIY